MGEKQIRAQADRTGAEVLGPMFKALGDLAVAAAEAGQDAELRAAADAKARQILDAAETEIVRRKQRWWLAWQSARQAGWSAERLRAAPINQRQPPAAYKPKALEASPRTVKVPAEDSTGNAEPTT